MFLRPLLRRSSPLGLSAVLRKQACSRSLSSLRYSQPALSYASSLRRFSVASPTPSESPSNSSSQNSHPPSGTCFIANLPFEVTAEQLEEAFAEFGKIKSVRLVSLDAGRHKGTGFVEFESVADAVGFVEASAADPLFVLDRQLFVAHARRATRPDETSPTLALSGFGGRAEGEIKTLFGDHADRIRAVRFSREVEPASRLTFIQFSNVEMATEALDDFRGRHEGVRIRYARERHPQITTHTLVSRLSRHAAD